MQRKLILLACFFFLTAVGSIHCFAQQFPFVYYTPKDGLINGRVKAIKQDSKGRMYFITYGGLSVYDGTKFFNYNRQDGLAADVINDIVEVSPDTILVASNAQKLNCLIRGKVGVYKTTNNFYPITNCFLKSNTGQWYVTADEGLFQLLNKKFTRLPLLINGIDIGRNLDKILEWKNYFLIIPWASEWNAGLILYDRNLKKVVDTLSREQAFGATIDRGKRIWITGAGGLKLLDTNALKQGRLLLAPIPTKFPLTFNKEGIGIHFDKDDNVWVFSKNDLQRISLDHPKEVIVFSERIKGGLNNIFQDREGIIWIALDGAGAVKLKSTNIQVVNSLGPSQQISFSAMTQEGNILWCYNRADNSIYRIAETEIKKFLTKDKRAIYNLLVSGDNIFYSDTRQLTRVENKNRRASYLSPIISWQIERDLLGNSIVDPFGSVFQLIQRNDSSYYLSVIKDDKIIFEYKISYMADQLTIDNSGKLWLATRSNHIMVFRINASDPSNYLQLENDFHLGLPEMNPRSIAVDGNGKVWVGSRYNGLYQFKQHGSSLTLMNQYTVKEGLTDNFIYTLLCDNNNTVWIGTQTGLDKIFARDGKYIIANPGKNNNIFQAVFKISIASNGTVWAMNNDGTLVKILPENSDEKIPAPPLLLTSVKVNDSLTHDNPHKFSYLQNNFSFSVATPSFFDEKSIRYSYLLEGSSNTHWSEPSNVSTFNFINLTPGHYTLHVKADYPEEKYPSQTITYSFTILPAWWQTWWFRLTLGLFIISAGVLINRSYLKRKLEKQKLILEKQQAIEKERTRIATDMHDDLGAGLSRIKFLSETIGIKKQQQQPIEEDISKIREYSHQMIDKMGEIVWALNERNDSLSDLLTYTRAYAMEYLSQNGIQCKVEIPSYTESYFLSGEFRRNIFLSVKEILHNIVKHSQASGVDMVIETENTLRIQIKDNGIGFNPSSIKQFSNGLYNIAKRMKEINGKSEIKSGEGTTVILMVPLPH